MIWLIIFGWIVCGVLAVGAFSADFQDTFSHYEYSKKEYWKDMRLFIGLGLFGPMAFIASLITSGFLSSGWTLRYRGK